MFKAFNSIFDDDGILQKIIIIFEYNSSLRNISPFGNKNTIIIEREQTLTHMHHAVELTIYLPWEFDVRYYMNLATDEKKIQYALDNLTDETIDEYMNAIAESIGGYSVKKIPGGRG